MWFFGAKCPCVMLIHTEVGRSVKDRIFNGILQNANMCIPENIIIRSPGINLTWKLNINPIFAVLISHILRVILNLTQLAGNTFGKNIQ